MARRFNSTGGFVWDTIGFTGPSEWTFGVWYKLDAQFTSAGGTFVAINPAGGGGFFAGIDAPSGGSPAFAYHEMAGAAFSTTPGAAAWSLYGLSRSGTTMTKWLNGLSDGTFTSASQTSGVIHYGVGADADGSGAFDADGDCAWAFFYDVALTAAEWAALGRGVSPLRIRPANLMICWPLWGEHTPEIDLSSGNRRHGTVSASGAVKHVPGPPVVPYSARLWPTFLVAEEGGPGANQGTGAGTLPSLTGSASGVERLIGAAAGTLPSFTASGAGAEHIVGAGVGTLPSLTGSAAGVERIQGAAAATAPSLTGSGAGVERIIGAGAGTLPSVTASATGPGAVTGTGAATLPSVSAEAAGVERIVGAGSGVLPSVTASAAGGERIIGTAAAALPALTGDAAGRVRIIGAGAGTLPHLVAAGVQDANRSGTGDGALPSFTAAASGRVRLVGQADALLPALSGQGLGVIRIRGAAAGTLPSLTGDAREVQPAFHARGRYAGGEVGRDGYTGTTRRKGGMTGGQGTFAFYDGGQG